MLIYTIYVSRMWSKQVTPAILYFCAAGPWWSWNLLWPRTIVPVPPVCWVQGGRSGYPELGSILQVTQITNKNQPFRYADTCWICVPCPIFIMGWHACTWWLYFYCWLKSLLRLLMMTILNCKEHSVFHFGLTCGTWVVTSRGSTLRHFLAPMGLLSAPSVKQQIWWWQGRGSEVLTHACLHMKIIYFFLSIDPSTWFRFVMLALLIHAKNGTWTLEQPSSSLLYRHERFQWLIKKFKVTWTI